MQSFSPTHISMQFAHKKALNDVTLTFSKGKMHALLGENGSGKSTLAHIATGLRTKTFGTFVLDGKIINIKSAKDALKHGIAMVHQNPLCAENLTIQQNIALSAPKNKNLFASGRINKKKLQQDCASLQELFCYKLDLAKKMHSATGAERFFTALFASLVAKPNILFLDEPTTFLSEGEKICLFKGLQKLMLDGLCIILITHSIQEALFYSDSIFVLKSGELVATYNKVDGYPTLNVIQNDLFGNAEKICAQTSAQTAKASARTSSARERGANSADGARANGTNKNSACTNGTNSAPLFCVKNLCAQNKSARLFNVSFNVKKSELVIIKGEKASGLQLLESILTGFYHNGILGTISFRGINLARITPAFLHNLHIAFVPSDKYFKGSNPALTIKELLCAPRLCAKNLRGAHSLHGANFTDDDWVALCIQASGVQVDANELVATCSGGMIQKLILAREIQTRPRFLILAEPFHGLDLKTQNELLHNIELLLSVGVGVLIFTSDNSSFVNMQATQYSLNNGKLVRTKEQMQ